MIHNVVDIESLSHIAEGQLAACYRKAMDRARADCLDRIGEKKPRTVSVVAKLVPILEQDGAVVDVGVDYEVVSAIPKHVTKTEICRATKEGQLLFNDLSRGNLDQRTLDEMPGAFDHELDVVRD